MADLGDRTKYLGASEIASILRVPGAYRSEWDVWIEKTGRAKREEEDEPQRPDADLLQLGHLLEPAILDAASAALLPGSWANGRPWQPREYRLYGGPPIRGHADGVVDTDRGPLILESKVILYGDIDKVLACHEIQTRTYMVLADACAGAIMYLVLPRRLSPEALIALLEVARPEAPAQPRLTKSTLERLGASLQLVELGRDEELEERILDRAVAWWEHHVIAGHEPGLDDSRAAHEWLRAKHSAPTKTVRNAPEAQALIQTYLANAQLERDAKVRKDAAANELRALIGDDYGVLTDAGKATWSRYDRRSIDAEAVRAEFGDRFDKVSPSDKLTVNGTK